MNIKNNGWVSIHREITEHPDYFSEKFTRMGAWIDLILIANHTDRYIRVRGIRIKVTRGFTATVQTTLAMRWQWSRGKVKRFLDELEKNEQIKIHRIENVVNLIELVNYDKYQSEERLNNNTSYDNLEESWSSRTPNNTANERPHNTHNDDYHNPTNSNKQLTEQETEHTTNNRRTPDRQQTGTNNNENNENNENNGAHTHTHNFVKNSLRARTHEGAALKTQTQEQMAKERLSRQSDNLLRWLDQELPAVQAMESPLSHTQAMLILRKHDPADVSRIFFDIYNKGRTEKNKSAYATFTAFADSDYTIGKRKQVQNNREFNRRNKEAIIRGHVERRKVY